MGDSGVQLTLDMKKNKVKIDSKNCEVYILAGGISERFAKEIQGNYKPFPKVRFPVLSGELIELPILAALSNGFTKVNVITRDYPLFQGLEEYLTQRHGNKVDIIQYGKRRSQAFCIKESLEHTDLPYSVWMFGDTAYPGELIKKFLENAANIVPNIDFGGLVGYVRCNSLSSGWEIKEKDGIITRISDKNVKLDHFPLIHLYKTSVARKVDLKFVRYYVDIKNRFKGSITEFDQALLLSKIEIHNRTAKLYSTAIEEVVGHSDTFGGHADILKIATGFYNGSAQSDSDKEIRLEKTEEIVDAIKNELSEQLKDVEINGKEDGMLEEILDDVLGKTVVGPIKEAVKEIILNKIKEKKPEKEKSSDSDGV